MSNRVKSIVRYLLLFLFIGYYSSITLFWHAHRLGKEIITHSHPFNNPGHSHSTAEYVLIKALSAFSSFAGLTGLLLAVLFFGRKLTSQLRPASCCRQVYSHTWFRRGPPVYQSI